MRRPNLDADFSLLQVTTKAGEDVWRIPANFSEFGWSPMVCHVLFFVPFLSKRLVLCRKTPWKLSVTRKANVRKRLKAVDAVIEAVRVSGVECSSLVRLLDPRNMGPCWIVVTE